MAKEHLQAVIADVDRLLVAGSTVAAGDEGLRRRERVLRELGQQVPALAKVAAAVNRVTTAEPSKAAPALLDLLLLTQQVRFSLAAAGAEGPLEAVESSGPWATSTPARDLYPLVEALTQTGAARLEVLKDAHARGLLGDLRLLEPLLASLDDGYGELADFVAEDVLPSFGPSLVGVLRQNLDLKGTAGNSRRLAALGAIEPEAGAKLCRAAFAEGNWKAALRAAWRLAPPARWQLLSPLCADLSATKKGKREQGQLILKLFEQEAVSGQPRKDWGARWVKLLRSHLDGPNRAYVAIALEVAQGAKTIPELLTRLKPSVEAGECGVVEALGRLKAREAIAPLIELLPGQEAHHYCIHDALRLIGDSAAVPALQKLLKKTKEPYRKYQIEQVITALQPDGKKA